MMQGKLKIRSELFYAGNLMIGGPDMGMGLMVPMGPGPVMLGSPLPMGAMMGNFDPQSSEMTTVVHKVIDMKTPDNVHSISTSDGSKSHWTHPVYHTTTPSKTTTSSSSSSHPILKHVVAQHKPTTQNFNLVNNAGTAHITSGADDVHINKMTNTGTLTFGLVLL